MKTFIYRIVGIALIIATAVGIIACLFGLIQIWRVKPALEESLNQNLELINGTISTTLSGLATVDDILSTASQSLSSFESSTEILAQSLEDTEPLFDSITQLTGEDLPEVISATQTSLASAQTTALLIDNVLTTLTSIPFLSLKKYQPEVPLNVSLRNISEDIDQISPSLYTISASLVTARENLNEMTAQIKNLGGEIEEISGNLENTHQVISEYQRAFTRLQVRVESIQEKAPAWLTSLAWGISLIIVWLVIIQLGLFVQGLEILTKPVAKEGSPDLK